MKTKATAGNRSRDKDKTRIDQLIAQAQDSWPKGDVAPIPNFFDYSQRTAATKWPGGRPLKCNETKGDL